VRVAECGSREEISWLMYITRWMRAHVRRHANFGSCNRVFIQTTVTPCTLHTPHQRMSVAERVLLTSYETSRVYAALR
jgi:hypothetical protein